MKNKHTLTRISEEAFHELTRIKQTTNLPHQTIMQLAIAKEVTESDLLKYPEFLKVADTSELLRTL